VQDLQAGFGWKTVQTASRYSHSKNRERDKRIQEATSNRIDRLAQVEVEAPPKKEYTYKAKGPRKPRTRERGKGRRGLALETLNLENLNAASSGEKALGKKTRKGSKSQESQGS
jgi:hypothetical protein